MFFLLIKNVLMLFAIRICNTRQVAYLPQNRTRTKKEISNNISDTIEQQQQAKKKLFGFYVARMLFLSLSSSLSYVQSNENSYNTRAQRKILSMCWWGS